MLAGPDIDRAERAVRIAPQRAGDGAAVHEADMVEFLERGRTVYEGEVQLPKKIG